MSPDGKVWTFKLRDDVKWHDGMPFSADDVLFTIRTIQNPGFEGDPGLAEVWRSVKAEKVDQFEVRFTLGQAYAPFLSYTTLSILPAHVLRDVPAGQLSMDIFNTQPVGTGPFMLKDQTLSARSVTLVANKQYYGDHPYVDGIRFQFYPNYEAALTALKQGEVQSVNYVPPAEAFKLTGDSSVRLYSAELSNCTILFLNLRLPIFSDKLVRQAIAYGVDRNYIVDRLLYGQGTVANSPVLPTSWAYDKNIKQYNFDRAKAQGLLDQAGWVDTNGDGIREKNGSKMAFTIVTNDQPERVAIANEIADNLKSLGMQVNVESKDASKVVSENLTPRNFQAVLYGWQSLPNDPDCYELWDSTQADTGSNFSGFHDQIADKDLEQARRSLNQQERIARYQDFQNVFAEEVPSLLIYYPVYDYAVSSTVGGVKIGQLSAPSDRFSSIDSWYVNTKRVFVEAGHAQQLR